MSYSWLLPQNGTASRFIALVASGLLPPPSTGTGNNWLEDLRSTAGRWGHGLEARSYYQRAVSWLPTPFSAVPWPKRGDWRRHQDRSAWRRPAPLSGRSPAGSRARARRPRCRTSASRPNRPRLASRPLPDLRPPSPPSSPGPRAPGRRADSLDNPQIFYRFLITPMEPSVRSLSPPTVPTDLTSRSRRSRNFSEGASRTVSNKTRSGIDNSFTLAAR